MNEDRERWAEWGRWLRARRDELGLSRPELAERSGVSAGTIEGYERGGTGSGEQWKPPNPRAKALHALAAALGVDPAEMFERAGRRYVAPPQRDIDPREAIADIRRRLADLERLLGP